MLQAASKRKTTVLGIIVSELFRTGLYKRTQGRVVRQATFGAIVAMAIFAAWRLEGTLGSWGFDTGVRLGVPILFVAAIGWFAYRLMNVPVVADFLIAVEAEMRKVTWPTKNELIRSCVVVLVTMFSLAICLTVYDFVWATFLRWLGVL
ncbi:Preprotein translocase subunit SecE [Thermogutta terrifontis]|uniref:Protein translocase subunit SecE n=1 Tax=Thermogutta terrifontis TaxID=1331910 RepID=A0A286RJH4_9BACT|nr:preprotein translocase subunit SecE [Thermogutta terrifontis]ASV76111.1 Preprotein translocase subunit SecE [Thermogutta terrifontis]